MLSPGYKYFASRVFHDPRIRTCPEVGRGIGDRKRATPHLRARRLFPQVGLARNRKGSPDENVYPRWLLPVSHVAQVRSVPFDERPISSASANEPWDKYLPITPCSGEIFQLSLRSSPLSFHQLSPPGDRDPTRFPSVNYPESPPREG